MSEEQIKLLQKALDLYDFTIEQRREDNSDVDEANEFFRMREALFELIGADEVEKTEVLCDNYDCCSNTDGICKAEIIKLEYDMGQSRCAMYDETE